jgi:myo-inositol-1(or 4)-monophosphatase
VTPRLLTDPAFLARFDPRAISSTLAVVWVASGRRAAYVIDRDVIDSVHFAAGIAVCRAAGCVVTDLRGGAVGDGPGLLVAADEVTHAALLPLLASALTAAACPVVRGTAPAGGFASTSPASVIFGEGPERR